MLLESLLFNSKSEKKIFSSSAKLRIKQNIPNTITLLRLIAIPHLIYSFNYLSMFVTFSIFLAAIISDLVDGYVARKISSTSKFGAYLDVIVDFLFIMGMMATGASRAVAAGLNPVAAAMSTQHMTVTIANPPGR